MTAYSVMILMILLASSSVQAIEIIFTPFSFVQTRTHTFGTPFAPLAPTSELNDEFPPLRFSSFGTSTNPNDTFGHVAALIEVPGQFNPGQQEYAVTGTLAGSGGQNGPVLVNYFAPLTLQILEPGAFQWEAFIGLLPGTTALLRACSTLNCLAQSIINELVITSSGTYRLLVSENDIENVQIIPLSGQGAWLDNLEVRIFEPGGQPPREGGGGGFEGQVPEPASVLLVLTGVSLVVGFLRRKKTL